MAELSRGESLRANIQLVLNNARVGTAVAVEYSRAQQQQSGGGSVAVLAVGGAVCDVLAQPARVAVRHDSNPGRVRFSGGGVARNIAHAVVVGSGGRRRAALVSAVGDDVFGRFVTSVTRGRRRRLGGVARLSSHSCVQHSSDARRRSRQRRG